MSIHISQKNAKNKKESCHRGENRRDSYDRISGADGSGAGREGTV